MKIAMFSILTLLMTSSAFGYDVFNDTDRTGALLPRIFSVANSTPVAPVFQENCPDLVFSNKTMTLAKINPKPIGLLGGDLGSVLDSPSSKNGDLATTLDSNLSPDKTVAIHFDMAYYSRGAEVIVQEITIHDENRGDLKYNISQDDDIGVLSESGGESMFVCFNPEDRPTHIKVKVVSRNVKGDRSTIGLTMINLKGEK